MVKRVVLGSLALALLATAGCSGGSPSSSSTPVSSSGPGSSASTDPSAGTAPSASASPSLATLPVAQCLTGTWTLVRFVGAGGNTYGTGEGGDVSVAFSRGAYTLTGAGKKPIELTLAGNHATLTVDGTVKGTYAVDGSSATFVSTGSTGTGTLAGGGEQRTLQMSDVSNVVGLQGAAQVACTSQAMTVTLKAVRLELGRL